MRFKTFSLLRWIMPLSLLLIASPLRVAHANEVPMQKKEATEPVQVKILSEEKTIQPGRPFWVGVQLKMADGWDTYWVNPGDAGFPTKVDWHLPEGFQAGPLQWPYPEKFTSQSLVGFGYTHSVLLLTQITPPETLKPGEKISLNADVSWLACKEQCIPGNAALSLELPVDTKPPALNTESSEEFAKARDQLPQEGIVTLGTQAEEIFVKFKVDADIAEALFIPEKGEVIDHSAPQNLSKSGTEFTLTVKRAHPGENPPADLKGILLVSEKESGIKKAIQVSAEKKESISSATASSQTMNFGIALGFAFVGGLILNVMPCVLPVIALKIFGFVKIAGQRRGEILKHGGVFALGVLVSFWILSGILLILRAYGEGIGWGFQLQEPVFVGILASILFLLGLSLFGLFEMGTSLISLGNKKPSSSPMGSSFMSGVLATLVATPCTGPLLGPALGFAMTLPTFLALGVFTSMGLGMAAPYLLFSAFPSLVRFLPKPGNWMIVFKQLMGFLMMGTVIWLLWVFGAQTSSIALFILIGCLLLLAFGGWIFGRWATPSRKKVTRSIATVLSALILLVGGAAIVRAAKFDAPAAQLATQAESEGWGAYTPEKVATLRKEGKAVFVDFTAKWCLICQANKVVLHSSEVAKAFQEKGVVTLTADWTKRDAIITEQLQKLGRSGVPVYALYPADEGQPPYILPQTLTGKVVEEYLGKLNSTTVDNSSIKEITQK